MQVVSEERIFQKSTNQKREWPVVAMFVNGSRGNQQSLQRTFHRCFLLNFSSFGKLVSEEKIFQKSTNQKQEWPVVAMFVNGLELNEQSRGYSNVLIHLAWQSQRRRSFRNHPIRNKNGLWRPCLLTDRDEMSNLYRGPSIDASYQVSVHLAKQFQRRRFKKIGQSETRIACGGHVC